MYGFRALSGPFWLCELLKHGVKMFKSVHITMMYMHRLIENSAHKFYDQFLCFNIEKWVWDKKKKISKTYI